MKNILIVLNVEINNWILTFKTNSGFDLEIKLVLCSTIAKTRLIRSSRSYLLKSIELDKKSTKNHQK